MIGIIVIITLTAVILVLILFVLHSYRDPERTVPPGNNLVSPADGKIIRILKIKKNKLKIRKGIFGKIITLTKGIGRQCYVISIFMHPLDVHVNRAPINGKVKSMNYVKGKFFPSYHLKETLYNEKNEIIIKNKKIGKIKIIQIAGFLSRRIICTLNKNQIVTKGQRIGKIVLGSQVTLILPTRRIRLRIRKNQIVKAGSTIIAELR